MDITIKHYQESSSEFIDSTFACDMSTQYAFFEKHLDNPRSILDLGFGSGRDSLYFQNKGYEVTSIDPTDAFIAQGKAIGLKHVRKLYAQELDYQNEFDGIWACSSLLHVPSKELPGVFSKCAVALKDSGVMYASFKVGEFEGERRGRYFLDLDEKHLSKLLEGTGLTIVESLVTVDVRPDRDEQWLNVILKKSK